MTNEPLISVIIPCYNAEKFVEEAVRSIMNQTYKNLEIICFDDYSTDSTIKILSRLAMEDSRIKIYKNEKNLKVSKTFNKGLEYCKGTYIARMDADDVAIPDKLEKQIRFLLDNHNVDIVGSNIQSIDTKNNKLNYQSKVPLEHDQIMKNLYYKCCMMNPTILAKKSLFLDLGGYRAIDFGEDYDLWIRAVFAGKILHNLKDILLLYRSHDNNLTGKGYNQRYASIIRHFLFEHMIESKRPQFLIGMIIQTHFFYSIIHRTVSLRQKIRVN